jgi:type II secretory pathway component PulJ
MDQFRNEQRLTQLEQENARLREALEQVKKDLRLLLDEQDILRQTALVAHCSALVMKALEPSDE